jgi:hypothetical protein
MLYASSIHRFILQVKIRTLPVFQPILGVMLKFEFFVEVVKLTGDLHTES